jgi:hypothetical protein
MGQTVTIWHDDTIAEIMERITLALSEVGVVTKMVEEDDESTTYQFSRAEPIKGKK